MSFSSSTCNGHDTGNDGKDIIQNLRGMVKRANPRISYYIEPTWRINGVPISDCGSSQLSHIASATKSPKPQLECDGSACTRKPIFKERLRSLRSPQLREIIMNASLKSLDTHKGVVRILKRMQQKKPRPISAKERIQRPTVGLYLYCRTQHELVDIVLELARQDRTGCFKQDIKDLIMIMEEKGEGGA